MVKLDADLLKYLESDDFRVLTAVEMGMKNHQLVPGSLIASIASLRGGGTSKILHNLTRNKLLVYERGKKYDGYRLTFHGYDYLALNVLSHRKIITHIGNQIGVGKESDVYIGANDEGERFAIKLHRLGRTCFRKVHDKRDYHKGKIHNWIYMSRLSANREFSFLKALHERGFPVPKPIEINRHCIVMELIDGKLLSHVADIEDKPALYENLMNLLLSLANDYGVVHGDFNEFNIMLENETAKPILIDFPQMISTNHKMAREYFQRDVDCIVSIFKRKYHFESEEIPNFDKDVIVNENDEGIINKLSAEANEYEPVINDSYVDMDSEQPKYSQENCDDSKDKDTHHDKSDTNENNGERIKIIDQNNSVISERQTSYSFSSDGSYEDSKMPATDGSKATYSVAGSTFTTEEIKAKVKKEFANRIRREELRTASKSIKGEDSAVRRQRRDNSLRIKEDKAFGNQDWFVQ
ncbi:serine/threonine-protein kinase RIO2 [Tetranychus urticae]|uniref:Serine/threonine-protein kinase RIO2 n=1 Tax=Tetranychus urticae TaxID=32264 RepID=A0A158P4K4_TETUR|nr:serine/threonine-protein kinase RIO2 [Tetranychus urticae]